MTVLISGVRGQKSSQSLTALSEHSTLHSIATQSLSAFTPYIIFRLTNTNFSTMELVWNCGIPPKTPILFYSIPGRNTLTCIQYTFTLQRAKFQNHSNSDISIPKPCSHPPPSLPFILPSPHPPPSLPTSAEIYHFQHERVVDFRNMMKFFLNEQIRFYQDVSVLYPGIFNVINA